MFIYCDHKVVIMPRAGEGRSIRIDPEVYEALLALKRGNMTFSDVIAQMLRETYGWSDDLTGHQSDLSEFTGSMPGEPQGPRSSGRRLSAVR